MVKTTVQGPFIAIKNVSESKIFISKGLDFLLVTETWLNSGELSPRVELCPPDFDLFFHIPRPSGRGGGIAAVFKKHFNCQPVALGSFSNFALQLK